MLILQSTWRMFARDENYPKILGVISDSAVKFHVLIIKNNWTPILVKPVALWVSTISGMSYIPQQVCSFTELCLKNFRWKKQDTDETQGQSNSQQNLFLKL